MDCEHAVRCFTPGRILWHARARSGWMVFRPIEDFVLRGRSWQRASQSHQRSPAPSHARESSVSLNERVPLKRSQDAAAPELALPPSLAATSSDALETGPPRKKRKKDKKQRVASSPGPAATQKQPSAAAEAAAEGVTAVQPDRIGKRPRRVRPPMSLLVPGDSKPVRAHGVKKGKRPLIAPEALQLTPPGAAPGLSPKRGGRTLRGQRYGPRNTCSVDTMLTLVQHVFTKDERRTFKAPLGGKGTPQLPSAAGSGGSGSGSGSSEARSAAAWRALLQANARHNKGDATAKRLWYAHMCDVDRREAATAAAAGGGGPPLVPTGKRAADACRCRCRCRCADCTSGHCVRCRTCACKEPRLLGHCFGLMEQFWLLLPDGLASSPLHMRTTTAWSCARCAYSYTAASPTLHVPLLLPAPDLDALIHAGVEREVGKLCAAHLAANPYDYGACPRCGQAPLRQSATRPAYSQLLLVELGRPAESSPGRPAASSAGGLQPAASRLPWRLRVAPEMQLSVDGAAQSYAAVAVVYNDGTHWWADLMCGRHFKGGQRGCYRYDGLEADGALRYAGPELTLTSDARLVSFVLYRRVDSKSA